MGWTNVAQVGMAAYGAYSSKKSAKDQAKANGMDPRIEGMLFGNGADDKGLLADYRDLMKQPQSDASKNFGTANAGYINSNAGADLDASRYAAYRAMGGNAAPQIGASTANGGSVSLPAYAVGSKVDAPAQNGINLSGSYNSLINGEAGNNPYLTGAIQKGINQSTNAFGNMVTDAKNATQDVLGSIRGNSVLAGQFGGSRQGIAEGKAIDSMNTNLARAASQFGQNNTDAAVAAQAGAYNSDRDRQLAATQGLGAQQYGVAQQNSANEQAAQFMNVGNHYDAFKSNANLTQQNNQFNAGLQQQAALANQQAQLGTNAQNNSSNLAGAGLLSGLLGQANANVNANDNWALNRAQGVNSLLAPYLAGQQSQPMTANGAGSAIGGGLMGLQLGGQLAGLFGGGSGGSSGGGFASMFGPGTIGAGV